MGKDWEREFQNFVHEATYAASLGQVHKATALDGTNLACKLQYPIQNLTQDFDPEELAKRQVKLLNP